MNNYHSILHLALLNSSLDPEITMSWIEKRAVWRALEDLLWLYSCLIFCILSCLQTVERAIDYFLPRKKTKQNNDSLLIQKNKPKLTTTNTMISQ